MQESVLELGDRLPALRDLFDVVVDLPQSERDAWIAANVRDASLRAALIDLLAADTSEGALKTPAAQLHARISAAEATPEGMLGREIGGFRLVRLLGQGGMASVFLGERVGRDFAQRAAIKLLRRGLYSELEQRLFLRERRVLASLEHPNIARLIDGGVTDAGTPYLVLEYVDGTPITHYASAQCLDVRGRLLLFLAVCNAVEAAHRALIVHRDIKPSNILVSEAGEVKLLDFGIAKLIEDDNEATGTVGVFTRDYAAPEQVRGGAITTATDVYGLGVLLHELLVGSKPEIDTESDASPRRPSSLVGARAGSGKGSATHTPEQLRRVLRGDLDNILLKALEVEPLRRYASAGAFADDIARHLSGRPVLAHPPSRWYRARKFVQRHRTAAIGTSLLLLAMIVAFAITLRATQVALRQAARAGAMRDFMVTAFEQAEPGAPRDGPPRITEITEQAIARARSDASIDTPVRTELLTHLATVLRQQGHLKDAYDTSRWNFDQAKAGAVDDPALMFAAGSELLAVLILSGRFDEARALADDLLERTRATDPATRSLLLQLTSQLASKQHDLRRAVAEAADALVLARATRDNDLIAQALGQYGNAQLEKGDYPAAVAAYNEQLSLRLSKYGPQHVVISGIHAALSRALARTGDLKAAQQHIEAAVAIDDAVLPKDHWRRALHLNALAMLRYRQRDFSGALSVAREGLRVDRVAHGDSHPDTANDLNSIGMLEFTLEDYAAAVASLAEALRLAEAQFGAEHHETAIERANYGVALAYSGDADGGAQAVRHAMASLDADTHASSEDKADAAEKYIRLTLDGLRADDINSALERIDVLVRGSKDPYWIGRSEMLLARALLQRGEPRRALVQIDIAERALGAAPHPDIVLFTIVPLLRAQAERDLGDLAASRKDGSIADARLAALANPPSQWVRELRELQQRLAPPNP